jgi:hypothetical protein
MGADENGVPAAFVVGCGGYWDKGRREIEIAAAYAWLVPRMGWRLD